jgi:hypothetical protein
METDFTIANALRVGFRYRWGKLCCRGAFSPSEMNPIGSRSGGGNSEGSICSFLFRIVVLVWLSVLLVLGLVWGQLSVGLELSMITIDGCDQVISFHCV